jgi:hypothetical protein
MARGRMRSGSRVFSSEFRKDIQYLNDAQEVAAKYPKGKTILIYVNPSDPRESYVDIALAGIDYGLSGSAIVGCILFFAFFIRRNGDIRV